MHVTLVHVQVRSEHLSAFIAATQCNHEASIQESGCLRFDVLQSPEDPCYFVLYEAYISAEDASAHKQTAHYFTWRATVEPMMAAPRRGESWNGLFPQ